MAAAGGAQRGPSLADSISPGLRAIITVAVMAATLMEVLDTSIVNVALPDMMGNLGATLDQIGWVSTGYIIANVIVLPLTGWLSDYFGRKRYLTYSVILFTIASAGCGLSHSLAQLVMWRVIQGAGGAAFLSTAQATLMEVYPPARRGFAQAIFGIGVVMAPTLGPTVGGLITDRYTWPWIFFVNLPIGILAGALTFFFVPDSPSSGGRRKADFLGIGFLAIGLGSLQAVLERGEAEDWFQTNYIVWLTVASLIGLALFAWWELRPGNENPAVNLRIVKNRNLAAGTIFAFALGFVLYGGIFVLPQFMQNVQNHTAEQTGLLLLPGGLASAMMMPIVGQLADRWDARILIGAGMCVFVTSMFQFYHHLELNMPDSSMFMPLMLRGSGIGLQFVPLSLVALGTLAPSQVGQGAGVYNLFRQLGGSFGIAILVTIVDRRSHMHYGRLAERFSGTNSMVQSHLHGIQRSLFLHGSTPDRLQLQSYKVMGGMVQRQAYVLTYMDIFLLMAYVGIASLALLFLFQRTKGRGAAGAAH